MIKIDMTNVTATEHENCIYELMELCNSYETYYMDNTLIPLNDIEELLDIYETLTNEFYIDTDINDIDYLTEYAEILK